MRRLFAFLVRLILLAVFTFAFVVLFEHGPAKFPEGARTEWNWLLFFVGALLSRQENAPVHSPPPTATASPAQKKSPPAGPETNRPASGTPAPIP